MISRVILQPCHATHSGFFIVKLPPPLHLSSLSPSCRAPIGSAHIAPPPPQQPIAEKLICIAARGSSGGKGEGPGDLLNQSWEARTGRRGPPGARLGPAGEGEREEDGGQAQRTAETAGHGQLVCSLPRSSPRPHFPPPLARSSILYRPLVLTPGVVPPPPLRIIPIPHRPYPELSPPALGSEGLLCLGGFLLGFIGE